MTTPGGFKDGRLYSLDNLPPLSTNKIWVGNAFGFPEEGTSGGINPSIFTSGGQVLSATGSGLSVTPAVTLTPSIGGQVLVSDYITPALSVSRWVSRLVEVSSPNLLLVGSTAGPASITSLTGSHNYLIGLNILPFGSTASTNVCVGEAIMTTLGAAGATLNTIMGYQAGKILTGNENTFIGTGAGLIMITGSYNTFIGEGAGGTITGGNNNTFVGNAATSAGVFNLTNAGAFGAGATVSTSNSINLGFGCNVGIGVPSPLQSLHVGFGAVSGVAAIQIQTSTGTSPSASAGTGIIYATGTNADSLWYQPGTGSRVPLNGGGGGGITYIDSGNVTPYTFFVGSTAGNLSLSGVKNSGSGINVLTALTTGAQNTAFGDTVLNLLQDGDSNVALGWQAGQSLVSGSNNTFIGTDSGFNTATGSNIVAFGWQSSPASSALHDCGVMGYNASVDANYAFNIGYNTGISGAYNVGINQSLPTYALHINGGSDGMGGNNNVSAIGLATSNSGSLPTATLGIGALYVDSSSSNLADRLWFQPGSGSAVPLVGGGGGGITFTDDGSTTPYRFFVGKTAGNTPASITGNHNTGVGIVVLSAITSGSENTAFGDECLKLIDIGTDNTAFGFSSLNDLQAGTIYNQNTAMGSQSGAGFTQGNDCTFLGAGATVGVTPPFPLTSSTAVGANALINQSYSTNLGGGSSGHINVGINQQTPNQALHVSAGVIPSSGASSNIAGIQMDVSTSTPTAVGTGGTLYVDTSGSGAVADRLWYQTGTGTGSTRVNLLSGALPSGGTTAQILTIVGTTPTWSSAIYDSGSGGTYTFLAGSSAGNLSYTGTSMAAAGIAVLQNLTTGSANVGFGQNLLNAVQDGIFNTGLGSDMARHVTSGSRNVFLGGLGTGDTLTTGANNIFIGIAADTTVPTVINSGAIGYNVSVSQNFAINIGNLVNIGLNQPSPAQALHISQGHGLAVAIQIDNTATANNPAAPGAGSGILFVNSLSGTNADQLWFQPGVGPKVELTGGGGGGITFTDDGSTTPYRFFVGKTAGNTPASITGNHNTGVGIVVLSAITSGSENTAFGDECLKLIDIGTDNTAFGFSSLNDLQAGTIYNQNTAIGSQSGAGFTQGNDCTFLGAGATVGVTPPFPLTSSTAVGANALINQSYSTNLGGGSSGHINVGINQQTPNQALHVSAGVIPSSGASSNIAGIQMDVSTSTPTAVGTGGTLYVDTSGSGTVADRLWYQTGTGSGSTRVNLLSGALPSGGTTAQILTIVSGLPTWGSRLYDSGTTNQTLFLGSGAGNISTYTGSSNIAIGFGILKDITTGTSNICVGNNNTLVVLIDGQSNTAFGRNALGATLHDSFNIAIGESSLSSINGTGTVPNTTSSYNIGIGTNAGTTLVTGINNIFIGHQAGLLSGTTLNNSGALGWGATVGTDYSFNIGYNSNAVGAYNVGINVTSPNQSLHVGLGSDGAGGVSTIAAIQIDTSTSGVPAIVGTGGSLYVTTSGGGIIADKLWYQQGTGGAPIDLTAGGSLPGGGTAAQILNIVSGAPTWNSRIFDDSSSLFVGATAGTLTSYTGTSNIAIGQSVLSAISVGTFNLVIGINNATSLTDGQDNISLGTNALSNSIHDCLNIAIGESALFNMNGTGALPSTTGSYNIAIGPYAGFTLITGTNNIIIGNHAGPSSGTSVNSALMLGFYATVSTDYCANIGYNSTTNGAYNVGINQPAPNQSLHVGLGSNGSGVASTIAGIQLDISTGTPPTVTAVATGGTLYVASSGGTYSADQLWYQGGVSSVPAPIPAVNILAGLLPTGAGYGQLLSYNGTTPVWVSRLVDEQGTTNNFFMGFGAGIYPTVGLGNTAFGISVLTGLSITGPQYNTGFGNNVGTGVTTSNYNTFFGQSVGNGIIAGDENTFIGHNCLDSITDDTIGMVIAMQNTAVGSSINVGNTAALTNCTFFGYNTRSYTGTDLINAHAWGTNAVVNVSDAICLGAGAKVGINQAAPNESLHISPTVTNAAAIYFDGSTQLPTFAGTNDGVLFVSAPPINVPAVFRIMTGSDETTGVVVTANVTSTPSPTCGTVNLLHTANTATITTTAYHANSVVLLTAINVNTAVDSNNYIVNIDLINSVVNTSFNITVSPAASTATMSVYWMIINPV